MKILIIAPHYPFYDKASGDLRFSKIIEALAPENEIWFCPLFERKHVQKIGEEENRRYRKWLEGNGVRVDLGGPRKVLRGVDIDVVFFEFFFAAKDWIRDVRTLRPKAKIAIDSVDVHFHRLASKAKLTGNPEDIKYAEEIKNQELGVYRQSDAIVVVTDDDGRLIANEVHNAAIAVIPNIHQIHEPEQITAVEPILTFVGGFAHEPNADAVLYFGRAIMPLIKKTVPDVSVNIIGNSPPPEVQALSDEQFKVLGYVPDTLPYLRNTRVSIAPLRFGAGMKGKIGEAMAMGLPVVTTTVGVEGIGLEHGENVLVGDTAEDFANEVVRLLTDEALWEKIRWGGWNLIREKYSEEVVKKRVVDFIRELKETTRSKSVSLTRRLFNRMKMLYEEHILWRIKGA